jgi:hypothetical protein
MVRPTVCGCTSGIIRERSPRRAPDQFVLTQHKRGSDAANCTLC